MQEVIPEILLLMKSASHSSISARMYTGDETSVISARVSQGGTASAISALVNQRDETSVIFMRYQSSRHGCITRVIERKIIEGKVARGHC